MKRVKSGLMGKNFSKSDSVFCLFYCTDAKPYEDYAKYKNSNRIQDNKKVDREYIMVLAQMRHDGRIGFPGGKLETYHNTLIEGLKKELREEINFVDLDELNLEIISTFADSKMHATTFAYKTTYEELVKIKENSQRAIHYNVENMGSFFFKIDSYTKKEILKHNFCHTGAKELELLLKKIDINR